MHFPEHSMTNGAAKSTFYNGAYGRPTSELNSTSQGILKSHGNMASLTVPNVTATPHGFRSSGGIDDTVLAYNSAPLKTTNRETDIARQVQNFSDSSFQINLLHNNDTGSSLTPGMPSLTYEKLAYASALDPQRTTTSRNTQKKLKGVDLFRSDITHGHGVAALPPLAISERFSAGAYHPSNGSAYQSRSHIAEVNRL
jgi:hypothetical protein